MCIKLVGLFTETLVCVIVNDPLVLFITFLMYPVLPTHVFVDRFKMCIGKGRSRSQACFCHYTHCMISDHAEHTFVLLRYSLGGDRPSQTTHHTLSPTPIRGLG